MTSLLLSVEDPLQVSTLVRAGLSSSTCPFKIRFPSRNLLTIHSLPRRPYPLSGFSLLPWAEHACDSYLLARSLPSNFRTVSVCQIFPSGHPSVQCLLFRLVASLLFQQECLCMLFLSFHLLSLTLIFIPSLPTQNMHAHSTSLIAGTMAQLSVYPASCVVPGTQVGA